MRFLKPSCKVVLSLVVSCAVLSGCSSDNGTEPRIMTLADLEGSWVAQTYKITNAAQPTFALEIIGFGSTFAWDADDSGNFSGSAFIPAVLAGQDLDLDFQGTFSLLGQDSIIINFVPEIPPFLIRNQAQMELVGNALTLVDRTITFDFDQDGTMEAAIFEGTLIRN